MSGQTSIPYTDGLGNKRTTVAGSDEAGRTAAFTVPADVNGHAYSASNPPPLPGGAMTEATGQALLVGINALLVAIGEPSDTLDNQGNGSVIAFLRAVATAPGVTPQPANAAGQLDFSNPANSGFINLP